MPKGSKEIARRIPRFIVQCHKDKDKEYIYFIYKNSKAQDYKNTHIDISDI